MSRTSLVALLLVVSPLRSAVADEAAPPAAPTGGGRRITVDDAVKLATDSNPQLASAALHRDQIHDQSNSLRGHMLPVVALSEELQIYTTPWTLGFPISPTDVLSVPARNQVTNAFVTALGQPVTGLLHLWEDRNSLDASAESADSLLQGGVAAIREAIESGYLRYFEAKATEEIAKSSEAELREQEELAGIRMKAGVLTKADVLRLTVAEANAKQQEIQAQAQGQITRASLLTAMGFSPSDTDVDFVEPTALEAVEAPKLTEDDAQQRASQKRPEAVAQIHAFDSATFKTRSQFYQLLPEINLEAAYVNVQGQVFAQQNAAYVGVKANWNIWEWGASWYQLHAAQEGADAAAKDSENTIRQVRVDASTKLFEAKSASAAVESAQAAIASAEESYRVSAELVRVGSATTTTDLLIAQTALTQAKLNLVRAKYEEAIATVALKRSIGE